MSDKVFMTDAQIAGFAQAAGITRNAICPLPKSAQAEQPPVLTELQKAALVAALRPKCVARAEALLHNDGLVMLLCAARGGDAALIGLEDNRSVLVPVGSDDMASTVLAHLFVDGEAASTEASLKTSSDSFYLLLAIADTYRRHYLAGLLNHEAQELPFALDGLQKTLEDAYNESDTRWLFPFVLMSMEYPIIEDMQAAMAGLYSGGILKANSLTLTEDGESLADELMYLQAAVHIQTRRVRGNALMREDILLLRTRESLWCAIPGKSETTLFTLSAEKMLELVAAITEELDEPQDDIDALQAQAKGFEPIPAAVQTPPVGSWQCTCGSMNKRSFCPKCGAKRPS